MENGIQEIKTTGRKGVKNFFKSSIKKIRNFDKEMSDYKINSFPIDLGKTIVLKKLSKSSEIIKFY